MEARPAWADIDAGWSRRGARRAPRGRGPHRDRAAPPRTAGEPRPGLTVAADGRRRAAHRARSGVDGGAHHRLFPRLAPRRRGPRLRRRRPLRPRVRWRLGFQPRRLGFRSGYGVPFSSPPLAAACCGSAGPRSDCRQFIGLVRAESNDCVAIEQVAARRASARCPAARAVPSLGAVARRASAPPQRHSAPADRRRSARPCRPTARISWSARVWS